MPENLLQKAYFVTDKVGTNNFNCGLGSNVMTYTLIFIVHLIFVSIQTIKQIISYLYTYAQSYSRHNVHSFSHCENGAFCESNIFIILFI